MTGSDSTDSVRHGSESTGRGIPQGLTSAVEDLRTANAGGCLRRPPLVGSRSTDSMVGHGTCMITREIAVAGIQSPNPAE